MFSITTRQVYLPTLRRAASTQAKPRGLQDILEKRSNDVVITFAKRTAVGRAKKGQLNNTPVDELLHALFKVCCIPTPFTTLMQLLISTRLPSPSPN